MRISTHSIFETGSARISELQANLNRTQQQIAAGRKILSPSDDPIGSARALALVQSDSVNTQFGTNRKNAANTLSVAEGVLGSITTVMHNTKTLIVSAGNGVLSDQERGFIANELQGSLDELLGYANATDGTDAYLFSGFSSTTTPYVKTAGGAQYNGDQGVRKIQVDNSRQLSISEVGSTIFGNIRTSNGQFTVAPNPSNSGQATAAVAINAPTSANLTGNNYEVLFDGAGTSFTVTNKTTGATVVPLTAYVSPASVTVDGMTITLTSAAGPSGVPGPNDKFSIQPGNQNIFETLTDLINALRTPVGTVAARLDLTASLSQANNNLDKSLGNVLMARTNFGISLKEIDELNTAGDATGVELKQQLAGLQDLDYAKAISELNQNQVILQAAQQSYVKTSSLSLFNYLN